MHRVWIFTQNNPENKEIKRHKDMNYLLYVLQKAPTTGTLHYQGYVQFRKEKSLSTVRRIIKDSHLEAAYGTLDDNKKYIINDEKKTNQGQPIEWGLAEDIKEERRQGKRKDIDRFIDEIKKKRKLSELIDMFPLQMSKYKQMYEMIKHNEDIKHLIPPTFPITLPWGIVIDKPDPAKRKRHWAVMGPSDIQKSWKIQEALMGRKYYLVGLEDKYQLEGYDDEELLVFDDNIPKDLYKLTDCCATHYAPCEIRTGCRYTRKYWTLGQTRTCILLFNNRNKPDYLLEEAFITRFTFINLYENEMYKK